MSPKYSIGSIQGHNVVSGDKANITSTVYVGSEQSLLREQALAEIRKLIALLSTHADMIDRPEKVREDAEAIEVALDEKTLKRTRIEELARKITAGLAGVTALAGALDAVQAAINHLFA